MVKHTQRRKLLIQTLTLKRALVQCNCYRRTHNVTLNTCTTHLVTHSICLTTRITCLPTRSLAFPLVVLVCPFVVLVCSLVVPVCPFVVLPPSTICRSFYNASFLTLTKEEMLFLFVK